MGFMRRLLFNELIWMLNAAYIFFLVIFPERKYVLKSVEVAIILSFSDILDFNVDIFDNIKFASLILSVFCCLVKKIIKINKATRTGIKTESNKLRSNFLTTSYIELTDAIFRSKS